jgi:ATP-dependent protease ClpP protease subunit
MVIKFNDKLDTESFNEFADLFIDALTKTEQGTRLKVFFTTGGGEVSSAYAMYELLEPYKDYIEIYVVDALMSSGIILLYLLKDFDVYLTDLDAEFLIHKIHCKLNTSHPNKDKIEVDLKIYNKKLGVLFKKLGLQEDKVERFNNGDDVYLTVKELIIMFPNVKIKKYL